MHVKSLVLGAAVAFQAAAAAENQRPRIYFPRHVKRQFTNTTITSPESFPPAQSTPVSSDSESRDFVTSFRSPVSELLSSESQASSSTASEEQRSGGQPTTIVISSTDLELPPAPTSPTTTPDLSFPPPGFSSAVSQSVDESSVEETAISERDSSTDSAVSTDSEASSTARSASEASVAPTSPADDESTTSDSPSIVIAPSGVVSSSAPTASSEPEFDASADAGNSTSAQAVSDLPETTPAPESSPTTRLLDPIISIVSDLVPPPASVNETESISTQEPVPSSTPVEADPTSDALDVTAVISSIAALPTLVEPSITPNSTESDLPAETSPPPVVSSGTSLPPVQSSAPPPVESPVPSNVTSDLPLPTVSGSTLPTVLPSQSGVIGNETSSVSDPSVPPTDLPLSSSVPSATGDASAEPTSTPPPVVSTSAGDESSTAAPAESTNGPSIDTWLPTTIIAEQSTPSVGLARPSGTGTTVLTMPSDLPRVISPEDVDLTQPEGTVLLQVGFLYAENYEFVTENPMAAAQIFTVLPTALGDGAQIDKSKIKVIRLVPFDTTASLGYVTTLARFWYPESMVDKLRMDIKIPNSLLYNNPEQLVFNLTCNINPAIDIIPGNEAEANSPGSAGSSPDSPNGNVNILGTGDSTESTPIQKGTAAAIGIGAVGVAAAYGAAMFLVARRYKQKKQAHRRASSMAHSSEMRYTGQGSPAVMGGALLSRDFTGYGGMAGGRNSHGSGRSGAGNSVRTAQISAPVAAENSLGWN